MASKKRKTTRGKTKKQSAIKKSRPRKIAIKAKRPKKSNARRPEKSKTSSKGRGSRKRTTVNTLSDIERELRDKRLAGAREADLQPDFQGLSRAEEADSESVEELVEEGNVFESGAVAGVQRADNEDEKEVRTRELPEDDVPDEYLENE